MAAHQLSSNLNLRESAKNSVRTRLTPEVQSSQHCTRGPGAEPAAKHAGTE